jgi:polyhydroxyalkanoate synthase
MANAFNMLRPNDLIWPYLVGRYLMGEEPSAFDMLYWNADSTRLPAANHAFYLRACYLENRLFRGEMEIGGVRLNLRKVKTPVYNLATKEDHIAPARSVLFGSQAFGGKVTFVLAGSGHIAGVVNPPSRNKYQYWTNGTARGGSLAEWMTGAHETAGSWWPNWQAWIERQDDERVKARKVGRGRFKPIEDAPGRYVKVKG